MGSRMESECEIHCKPTIKMLRAENAALQERIDLAAKAYVEQRNKNATLRELVRSARCLLGAYLTGAERRARSDGRFPDVLIEVQKSDAQSWFERAESAARGGLMNLRHQHSHPCTEGCCGELQELNSKCDRYRAALEKAERKLTVYSRCYPDDKETRDSILPMCREALKEQPRGEEDGT